MIRDSEHRLVMTYIKLRTKGRNETRIQRPGYAAPRRVLRFQAPQGPQKYGSAVLEPLTCRVTPESSRLVRSRHAFRLRESHAGIPTGVAIPMQPLPPHSRLTPSLCVRKKVNEENGRSRAVRNGNFLWSPSLSCAKHLRG